MKSMRTAALAALWAIVLCVLLCGSAHGQTRDGAPTGSSQPLTDEARALRGLVQTARGLSGTVEFEHASADLKARPNDAFNALVVVRLERESAAGASPATYRLDYRVAKAGEFDLATYLEDAEGVSPTGVASLKVKIVSNLPATHGSDLFGVQRPGFRLLGYYGEVLIGLGMIWVLIPVVVWVRRRLNAPAPVVVVPRSPPPTLAEQIRELVAGADGAGLTVSERGRLELLLLGFWRDRLGLDGLGVPEAVMRMRSDEEAGELLRAVERWLHGPDRSAEFPQGELTRMLERYEKLPRAVGTAEMAEAAG